MKWTTRTIYVDLQTGEVITKKNATKNYIIKTKQNESKTEHNWKRTQGGGQYREDRTVRTITYGCTKEGKQIDIW